MTASTFHVALFSLQARELRVAGIVLAHIKSAQHRFELVDRDAATIDIAIVDTSDARMLAQVRELTARRPGLPLVHLVNGAGQSGTRNELLPGQMMSHLVPMLQHLADGLVKGTRNNVVPLQTAPAAPRLVAVARAAAAAPAPAPAADPGIGARPQLRVLIVDDSPTVRAQMGNIVTRIGMHFDTAASATEALVELALRQYDLIYVDVVMPDMDGYKLTRAIKRDKRHRGTPVIILTSQSSPFDRARGALAGCDLFVTKPLTVKAFYEATTKGLRKSMAVDDLGSWLRDPSLPQPAPPQMPARAAAPTPAPSAGEHAAPPSAPPAAPRYAPLSQQWDLTMPIDLAHTRR